MKNLPSLGSSPDMVTVATEGANVASSGLSMARFPVNCSSPSTMSSSMIATGTEIRVTELENVRVLVVPV